MAKFSATHPLDEFFSTVGKGSAKGVTVECIDGRDIIQVFASNGKTKAVERTLGIKETPGQSSSTKDYLAIPLCPGEWMLVSSKANPKDFAKGIAAKLKKNGYVSEQSDARVIFRISGPKARELMQKGCRLDLHPSATKAGWCAQTQMAQVGTIIHQNDDKPTYDISVYSGFAQHFAEWLLHSGAQLGLQFKK